MLFQILIKSATNLRITFTYVNCYFLSFNSTFGLSIYMYRNTFCPIRKFIKKFITFTIKFFIIIVKLSTLINKIESIFYFLNGSFNSSTYFCTFNFSINIISHITNIQILFINSFLFKRNFMKRNFISLFIFNIIHFPTNTINTINIKVRTGLSNPFVRNYNCRTKSVISKSYYFKYRYRLFTLSRNTITNMNIKSFFFYLFNKFCFFFCIFSFRNKFIPTRKINLHNSCFRIKFKTFAISNSSNLCSMPSRKNLSSNFIIIY